MKKDIYIITTRTDEESIWQKKTNRRKSFLKMIPFFAIIYCQICHETLFKMIAILAFFFYSCGCLHFLFILLTRERQAMLVVSEDVAINQF